MDGHPVAELYPLGVTVTLEATLSPTARFSTCNSPVEVLRTSKLQDVFRNSCQDSNRITGEKGSCSDIEVDYGSPRITGETCEHIDGQINLPGQPTEPFLLPGTSVHTHNHVDTNTSSQHHKKVVDPNTDCPQEQMGKPSVTFLAVHRSHSDSLSLVQPQDTDSQNCAAACYGDSKTVSETGNHSLLTCDPSKHLQQCSVGEGRVPEPCWGRYVHIASPTATTKEDENCHRSPKCELELGYGSYIHQTHCEDTFAAYCHPQPVLSPSQLLPPPGGTDAVCSLQRSVGPPLAGSHLTLPRLISSVSETGLDAKHLLHCCNLNCSWISCFPPAVGPQCQKHLVGEVPAFGPITHTRPTTQDTGTMTGHKEFRDVGVQASETDTEAGTLRVPSHVIPHILLTEDSGSDTTARQTANTCAHGSKKPGGPPKSPVKEVKWDSEGMTWEVYGASVDPEELGLAIQRHLELQIKETASRAMKLSSQNANTAGQSGQRMRNRIMDSLRTPACCSRTPAVD
ncbi:uncharacterized protein si:dkey-191g9.7 [Thalassophryne amazonica]|uniref:uncharacterized protein si:dkey-191g9.7 n=1 Tax=Thalassophryne amazonica TaxID=390379 RepID=UPI0014712FBA|nr:uncharacterized protein si:dkey-191g9.7 [Thalassophryne amazonica]